jgi:hypothetical protein
MALHNETGKLGEALVRAVLTQVGPVEESTVADLRFAGLEIEVKAALPSRYDARGLPGFQFCLHRAGRNGVRADVVILLAISDGAVVPFVMPAAVVGERPKVTVYGNPLAYNGQWARWRARWETLAEVHAAKGAVWTA